MLSKYLWYVNLMNSFFIESPLLSSFALYLLCGLIYVNKDYFIFNFCLPAHIASVGRPSLSRRERRSCAVPKQTGLRTNRILNMTIELLYRIEPWISGSEAAIVRSSSAVQRPPFLCAADKRRFMTNEWVSSNRIVRYIYHSSQHRQTNNNKASPFRRSCWTA